MFDRSFLPEVDFEFVVISDTHYTHDPNVYGSGSDSQDVRYTRDWTPRAERALQLVAALETSCTVHLGDVAQEYPGQDNHVLAHAEAQAQIQRYGLQPYYTPGNMDIGDKPNSLVPAPWVRPQDLADWHERYGRSWYSFDEHGIHFICLNSQIMNGPLPEAGQQRRWLEADLAEHVGQRIFMFLHMPPFLVDEHEPGFGSYNCLDEPVRRWMLGLVREYNVELLCSGHTHFAAYNRIGQTRFFVLPSTATSRPGFNEVFSLLPDHRGKNDVDKLGFYLARVREKSVCMHLIRTNGETELTQGDNRERRLLTRLPSDLPHSTLGVYLRLPLAPSTPGVLAWPDAVRQRVRDDYPFLACLELGARHLRTPAADLEDLVQAERLRLARDEGLQLTATWLWSDQLDLVEAIRPLREQVDVIEIQTPGTLYPKGPCLEAIARCRHEMALPLTLAPLLAQEQMADKYHPRMRVGYHATELAALDQHLAQCRQRLERVLCTVADGALPWDVFQEFGRMLPLGQIGGLDIVLPLPGIDDHAQANRVAEAMFAAVLLPDCRLFLDPLVDVDRSSDINHGLLDRLSNPRPAFFVARFLNTILFSTAETYRPVASQNVAGGRLLRVTGHTHDLRLILPDGDRSVDLTFLEIPDPDDLTIFDLIRGTSQRGRREVLQSVLTSVQSPTLLRQEL